MNILDILIVFSFVLFVILGYRDGFTKKVFGILGFWGGLILATKFMPGLAAEYQAWLDLSNEFAMILSFSTIFVLFSVAVNLVYRWFGRSADEAQNVSSRLGGAVLGGAQGALAISLALVMLNVAQLLNDDTMEESMLFDTSVQIAPMVFDYSTQWIPESRAFLDEIELLIKHSALNR